MTPTKFLVGQIAIVFAVAIGGLWFATQWAAWQSGLSSPAWRCPGSCCRGPSHLSPVEPVRLVVCL